MAACYLCSAEMTEPENRPGSVEDDYIVIVDPESRRPVKKKCCSICAAMFRMAAEGVYCQAQSGKLAASPWPMTSPWPMN